MPTKKKARIRTKKDFDVMTVKQVMQKQVQAVHLKTKGDVVASLMVEGFGAVPVVDAEDKLLGIVSEHDLLAALSSCSSLPCACSSFSRSWNQRPVVSPRSRSSRRSRVAESWRAISAESGSWRDSSEIT